jgi:hypothetical protein
VKNILNRTNNSATHPKYWAIAKNSAVYKHIAFLKTHGDDLSPLTSDKKIICYEFILKYICET